VSSFRDRLSGVPAAQRLSISPVMVLDVRSTRAPDRGVAPDGDLVASIWARPPWFTSCAARQCGTAEIVPALRVHIRPSRHSGTSRHSARSRWQQGV